MRKVSIIYRRTTLISCGLTAFLCGIGLARLKIEIPIIFISLSLVFMVITARSKNTLAMASIVIFGLTLGWSRGSVYMAQLKKYDLVVGKKVTIIAKADVDAVYGDKSQLTFDIAGMHVQKPSLSLPGKMTIKGFGVPMVYKGNTVRVSGKVYRTRGSKQAGISFTQIELLDKSTSLVDKIRRKFEAGMQSALPEPMASFGLGLLIGQRSTLPKEVTFALAAVGLTHIVAVSGYNLTIIIRGVRRTMKKTSKYQNTLASLMLIFVFLLFTGFSASIVRAAIVSVLSLWAWYYGRAFRPIVLILLAAVITAGFYPIYLWSDIGWYLSFLAFFGVLVVAPLASKKLIKKSEPKPLTALVFESFAAQLMTLPIIMYIFGQFSIIALFANILIVPLVPLAMLLSVVAGGAGMLIPAFSGWLSWPARLLLTYMLDAVNIMAKLPHALAYQPLEWWQMLLMYGAIVFATLIAWRKTTVRYATITDIERDFEGADK